jgi:hypothetical protein
MHQVTYYRLNQDNSARNGELVSATLLNEDCAPNMVGNIGASFIGADTSAELLI